jgi:anhydro-N-acetylmuramic acid kinase
LATASSLFIGLMSGTSVDGIDAALVDCSDSSPHLVATHAHPLPADVRDAIAQISADGSGEIERLGPLDRTLGRLFAEAALTLLEQAGQPASAVTAIGSHGQTIRHRPPSAGHAVDTSFTLQIADPNTIAEHTGITTVADFRRRDIAAGGEGAPLAPAFHAATMGELGRNRAIINIGGIANATVLQGTALTGGFDTGPGNTLLDGWSRRVRGQAYDAAGAWAATGTVHPPLLEALLAHPYLARTGVRSTGKEIFHLDWLDDVLKGVPEIADADVQATLAQLTATSIARALAATGVDFHEVFVCGGGVHNRDLLERLQAALGAVPVDSTQALGIDPDWVEAIAFAWLASRCLAGLPGNAPAVTGARGPRILGGIYRA